MDKAGIEKASDVPLMPMTNRIKVSALLSVKGVHVLAALWNHHSITVLTSALSAALCLIPITNLNAQPSPQPTDPGTVASQQSETDHLIHLFSEDGFDTLEDGQPGAPGELAILGTSAFLNEETLNDETLDDRLEFSLEAQYTLSGGDFFNNAQISLLIPLSANGDQPGFQDLQLNWLERWVHHSSSRISLSTVVGIEPPTSARDERWQTFLTASLGKALGPGAAYLNSGILTPESYFVLSGYKLPVSGRFALIGTALREWSRSDFDGVALELSTDWAWSSRLKISPGTSIRYETPGGRKTWAIGALFLFVLAE